MVNKAPSTVLITGANRGVGLDLVRQYANEGWRIHACCRDPENAHDLRDALLGHDGVIHPLDVTDHQSIHDLKDALEGEAVDVLINNAGVFGGEHQSFGDMDYDAWASTLEGVEACPESGPRVLVCVNVVRAETIAHTTVARFPGQHVPRLIAGSATAAAAA